MAPESDCPVVVLVTGQTLRLRKVMLYDEEGVRKIASLRATAAKNIGISAGPSGLGVIGSPSWELLGGAVAVSVVGGVLSGALQKQAVEMIQIAQARSEALAKSAFLFDTSQLSNIHLPHPGAWFATTTVERPVDITPMGRRQIQDLLQKHNKTNQDIVWEPGGKQTIRIEATQRHVHNGDEFINVEIDVGVINIRWAHVVAYFPPQTPVTS